MNISDWPIHKIMQLPDYCFGAREERIFSYDGLSGAEAFLFSSDPLPNICVIWELYCNFWPRAVANTQTGMDISIRLSDRATYNLAVFNRFELVFRSVITSTIDRGTFQGRIHLTKLRKVIFPQGRRFIVYVDDIDEQNQSVMIAMVISSIPTEVPD